MSHNQISVIPPKIGDLRSLEFFGISNNQIRNIPREIETLASLIQLDVSNNPIRVIPDEIQALKAFRLFKFSNNNINVVSEAIENIGIDRENQVSKNEDDTDLFRAFCKIHHLVMFAQCHISEIYKNLFRSTCLQWLWVNEN